MLILITSGNLVVPVEANELKREQFNDPPTILHLYSFIIKKGLEVVLGMIRELIDQGTQLVRCTC